MNPTSIERCATTRAANPARLTRFPSRLKSESLDKSRYMHLPCTCSRAGYRVACENEDLAARRSRVLSRVERARVQYSLRTVTPVTQASSLAPAHAWESGHAASNDAWRRVNHSAPLKRRACGIYLRPSFSCSTHPSRPFAILCATRCWRAAVIPS
jgi:hypothetical protein